MKNSSEPYSLSVELSRANRLKAFCFSHGLHHRFWDTYGMILMLSMCVFWERHTHGMILMLSTCVFWERHTWYDADVIVCVYFGRDTYGMILML